jgi:F-type H+-transporting ATPase subunit delta
MFEVAKEEGRVVLYNGDMILLKSVFEQAPEYGRFLDSPNISDSVKYQTIDQLLASRLHPATVGFLKILTKKKVMHYFPEIADDYQHCYNVSEGILEGRIYTPFPLSEAEVHKLEDVFSRKYEKHVVFRVHPDKRVIAGMKIYLEDTLYDYSVDTEINNIKKSLLFKKSL